ncbi:PepSY domain-containing protein [Streptomyces sp. N35]|uniref:PepSY domain-containing protein n=1 Tax=Streptomyces sp. N35 TaxID=2795730 RepID=UPI0018F44BE5|nr:PepSY domain-containing protein [Streptomyces sp. N35]
MKRSNIVIAGVAVATLVAGGSAYAFATGTEASTGGASSSSAASSDGNDSRDDDRRGSGTSTVSKGSDSSDSSASEASRLTAAQAIDAALKAQPGTAVSADLEDDDDRDWQVDILGSGSTWYEVKVDAKTGKILGKETERDDDDAADAREARAALKGSTVSAKQAAEIASAKGFVTSVDLDGDDDDDRGARTWDVETTDAKGKERDWNVDTKSSRITEDRDDRDDRDDADDRADDRDDRNDADDRNDTDDRDDADDRDGQDG